MAKSDAAIVKMGAVMVRLRGVQRIIRNPFYDPNATADTLSAFTRM